MKLSVLSDFKQDTHSINTPCDTLGVDVQLAELQWPVLVCYQGDDELVYIADEAAWLAYCDEAPTLIAGEDKLIDASGQLYHMIESDGQLVLFATNRIFLFAELLALVRKNACLVQQSCSAKIDANTYRQLIHIVYDLNRVESL
ncbi:DUF4144 family protein [uncultured Shewanella sp.]|uniref:DUF4144 family protein n=1 Tax=uncultured Shewanella sp. TaxID=173975 RepID=UPI00260670F7|nr:DUF4144 family protein [uncultured Shewanella sp.]